MQFPASSRRSLLVIAICWFHGFSQCVSSAQEEPPEITVHCGEGGVTWASCEGRLATEREPLKEPPEKLESFIFDLRCSGKFYDDETGTAKCSFTLECEAAATFGVVAQLLSLLRVVAKAPRVKLSCLDPPLSVDYALPSKTVTHRETVVVKMSTKIISGGEGKPPLRKISTDIDGTIITIGESEDITPLVNRLAQAIKAKREAKKKVKTEDSQVGVDLSIDLEVPAIIPLKMARALRDQDFLLLNPGSVPNWYYSDDGKGRYKRK